jgi:HD superfamily phosphohydrolase
MKNSNESVAFADVVQQSISFSRDIESQALLLELIDTAWFQRLRDVSQTANTRLVYMFSEHTRFGHSLGVAAMAEMVLTKLSRTHSKEVEAYRPAVAAAALLHDVGHLAPGSHTAFKTWFPHAQDIHETLGQ